MPLVADEEETTRRRLIQAFLDADARLDERTTLNAVRLFRSCLFWDNAETTNFARSIVAAARRTVNRRTGTVVRAAVAVGTAVAQIDLMDAIDAQQVVAYAEVVIFSSCDVTTTT